MKREPFGFDQYTCAAVIGFSLCGASIEEIHLITGLGETFIISVIENHKENKK